MSTTEPTRPEDLEKVVGDEDAAESVREADARNGEPDATSDDATDSAGATGDATPRTQPPGTDTPTGTDPDATYDQPGYEDKSLGQAVAQDDALVDRLMAETGGDEAEAEERFANESAGRTTLSRQREQGGSSPAGG